MGDVLGDLRNPALPDGAVALREAVGSSGWSVRVTANLDDEEVLGLLVGYVEHAKQQAADSWDDTDPTRADGIK